jgi:hypothetical protein
MIYINEKDGTRTSFKPYTDPCRVFSDNDFIQAGKYQDMIKKRIEQEKKLDRQTEEAGQASSGSAANSGAGDLLLGAAVGASASVVGFGLKGIWKIIAFPFWLMFWMFKIMFWIFKALFYTFPKFLWNKGTAGKIVCGVYLFAWIVAIFIESMGKAYVFRNWIYLSIILFGIIATAGTTITFRLLDKQFTKRFVIALSGGILVIGITVLVGMVFTQHLKPLEGEVISIKDRYKTEDLQMETVGEHIREE